MGAHNVSHRVPKDVQTPEQLRKYWPGLVSELLHEHGHDTYNGTLSTCSGLTIDQSKVFDNEQAADEYILERTHKWDNAMAVKVKTAHIDMRAIEADPKAKALRDELNKALVEQSQTRQRVLLGMSEGAATRSCPVCKSKIAMTFVNGAGAAVKFQSGTCPVCREGSLLLKGEKAQLERVDKAVKKVQAKQIELQQALVAKAQAKAPPVEFWYIAGWAAN